MVTWASPPTTVFGKRIAVPPYPVVTLEAAGARTPRLRGRRGIGGSGVGSARQSRDDSGTARNHVPGTTARRRGRSGGDNLGDAGPARTDDHYERGTGGGTSALVARLFVRGVVVLAAGVMAAGFVDWRAGVLVAVLASLSYVLLATLAPRLLAPYGRGRLLRVLQGAGYHVLSDGGSRHLAVGPAGVFLLETRVWRNAVSRGADDWFIGQVPAKRVVERMVGRALRIERRLHLPDTWPGTTVIPVIMVAGRLPEPVMRAGRAIIARPRGAVGYIRGRPNALCAAEIEAITTEARALSA